MCVYVEKHKVMHICHLSLVSSEFSCYYGPFLGINFSNLESSLTSCICRCLLATLIQGRTIYFMFILLHFILHLHKNPTICYYVPQLIFFFIHHLCLQANCLMVGNILTWFTSFPSWKPTSRNHAWIGKIL
jgi:hypothetical protein